MAVVTEEKVKAVYEHLSEEDCGRDCGPDCPTRMLLDAIVYYGSSEFAKRYERGKLPADISNLFDVKAAKI